MSRRISFETAALLVIMAVGAVLRVILTATGLFALAPVYLQYAQDARPYALLGLAAASAIAGACGS